LLDAKEVREAARPFARILVRVPEAYALLVPYEAVRPGLLVLDADGRRVAALPLVEGPKGSPDAVAVARFLRDAVSAPAMERITLKVVPPAAAGTSSLVAALAGIPGVEKAEAGKDGLSVVARAGALSPTVVSDLAKQAGAGVEFVEPVPVAFSPGKSTDALKAARALAGSAGTWYASDDDGGLRAWVTALLLDPRRLEEAAGCPSDLEVRRYDLPSVSTGPSGMRISPAVRAVPGVLGVVPSLASESLAVIGRRERVRWPDVLAALQAAGVQAREGERR